MSEFLNELLVLVLGVIGVISAGVVVWSMVAIGYTVYLSTDQE